MSPSQRRRDRPVENLREVLPSESRNFTPWLCENLDQLGATADLSLGFRDIESSVHSRFVDIVADETTHGVTVVIENQYGESDGDHLGRLIAYAAGKRASILVWLAEDFRDEFLKAVDWINEQTNSRIEVYAVAFRIFGDAESFRVEFSLRACPPAKSHLLRYPSPRPRTKHGRRRAFYAPIIEHIAEFGFREIAGQARKLLPLVGTEERAFESGFDGLHYVLGIYDQNSGASVVAQVQLMIHGGGRDRVEYIYNSLSSQKAEILAAWGNPSEDEVRWGPIRGKPRYFIGVKRPARIYADETELREVAAWMTHWLPRVRDVLEPRLRQLIR